MPAPDSLRADQARVRMYRVGFGDCFLLSLPVAGQHQHILVDCGVHPSGDIKTMAAVVADIAATTGRELALVVATHEHADHISGFGTHADTFASFKVGELWMPWAMNPDDPKAVDLRKGRLALAGELTAHFAAAGAAPAARDALLNILGNDAAMAALRSGFKGAAAVKYFSAGDTAAVPATLSGVSAKVLGPPRDDAFIKRMEPPRSERYFRLDRGFRQTVNETSTFADKWRFRSLADGRRAYGFPRTGRTDLSEKTVADGLAGALDHLAFQLDSVVNNTSLVLLLGFRGQSLLFPGDAQWGNWQAWLQSSDSAALLEAVTFLKVAHHGSYNATPRSALEKMSKGAFAAMVSTQSVPWPSIPRPALMTKLASQSQKRMVQSDSIVVAQAPKGPSLSTVPRGFKRGTLWFDYILGV
jgi:beta-lactamase superfamily II metal-dependent hydrolase